jgi:hypothetical protein
VLIGLRGVGKTALLLSAARDAESLGMVCLALRCVRESPLLPTLELALRSALLLKAAGPPADRKAAAITDCLSMLVAASNSGQALLVCVDDAHRLATRELDQLLMLLRAARAQRLSVGLLATALPGNSQPIHREVSDDAGQLRLEFPVLPTAVAAELLVGTALPFKLKFEASALAALVAAGAGHPLTLQQLGASAWLLTECTPVRMVTAQRAIAHARLQLDAGFYHWRAHQLGPQEQLYLRAAAALGTGPYRSGDIAAQMRRKVTALAPTRSALIAKELLYSPRYGETAFTTPGYAGYLQRT